MKRQNKKGITLVEIMMTVLIFSVISAGIYASYLAGIRSWEYHNQSIHLQRNLLGALEAMMKELREAENILITEEDGVTTLRFHRPGVGSVAYTWTGQGKAANQIIRKGPVKTRILGRDITSVKFHYIDDTILIDMTASNAFPKRKPLSYHLEEKVALRQKTGLIKK